VGNNVINRWDLLGLACTQKSFKWIVEPELKTVSLTFKAIGDGAQTLTSVEIIWKGTAEVECCCDGVDSTAQGDMIGTNAINTNADNLLITGGSPFPAISVPSASSYAGAFAKILSGLIGKQGIPANFEDEVAYVADAVDGIVSGAKDTIPEMKWESGWPCGKKK
jgi:hypothetical protein